MIAESLCNTYTHSIKLANILAAAVSPALSLAYEASGHPVVQGGMSASDPGFVLASHSKANCDTGATSAASCSSAGCTWYYGAQRCVQSDTPWLLHQSYPIEASIATLVTTFLNYVYFWPQYMVKNVFETLMKALQMQATSEICPECFAGANASSALAPPSLRYGPLEFGDGTRSGANSVKAGAGTVGAGATGAAFHKTHLSVNSTMDALAARLAFKNAARKKLASLRASVRTALLGTPHAIVINYARNYVLPPRDIFVAFYEFVRACVYVGNPADLATSEFVRFSTSVRDTVDVVELFYSVASEALIEVIQTGLRMLSDFIQILTDPSNAGRYFADIIRALGKVLVDLEGLVIRFFLNIPGIKVYFFLNFLV